MKNFKDYFLGKHGLEPNILKENDDANLTLKTKNTDIVDILGGNTGKVGDGNAGDVLKQEQEKEKEKEQPSEEEIKEIEDALVDGLAKDSPSKKDYTYSISFDKIIQILITIKGYQKDIEQYGNKGNEEAVNNANNAIESSYDDLFYELDNNFGYTSDKDGEYVVKLLNAMFAARNIKIEPNSNVDDIANAFKKVNELSGEVKIDNNNETPKSETPKSETPQSETPQSETPQSETPQSETPQSETPQSETPQSETPQSETPQSETPQPVQQEAPKKDLRGVKSRIDYSTAIKTLNLNGTANFEAFRDYVKSTADEIIDHLTEIFKNYRDDFRKDFDKKMERYAPKTYSSNIKNTVPVNESEGMKFIRDNLILERKKQETDITGFSWDDYDTDGNGSLSEIEVSRGIVAQAKSIKNEIDSLFTSSGLEREVDIYNNTAPSLYNNNKINKKAKITKNANELISKVNNYITYYISISNALKSHEVANNNAILDKKNKEFEENNSELAQAANNWFNANRKGMDDIVVKFSSKAETSADYYAFAIISEYMRLGKLSEVLKAPFNFPDRKSSNDNTPFDFTDGHTVFYKTIGDYLYDKDRYRNGSLYSMIKSARETGGEPAEKALNMYGKDVFSKSGVIQSYCNRYKDINRQINELRQKFKRGNGDNMAFANKEQNWNDISNQTGNGQKIGEVTPQMYGQQASVVTESIFSWIKPNVSYFSIPVNEANNIVVKIALQYLCHELKMKGILNPADKTSINFIPEKTNMQRLAGAMAGQLRTNTVNAQKAAEKQQRQIDAANNKINNIANGNTLGDNLKNGAQALGKNVVGALGTAGNTVTNGFIKAGNTIANGAKALGANVADKAQTVKSAANVLGDKAEIASLQAANKAKETGGKFATGINNYWNGMKEKAKNTFNFAKDEVKDDVNSLKTKVNNLKDSTSRMANSVKYMTSKNDIDRYTKQLRDDYGDYPKSKPDFSKIENKYNTATKKLDDKLRDLKSNLSGTSDFKDVSEPLENERKSNAEEKKNKKKESEPDYMSDKFGSFKSVETDEENMQDVYNHWTSPSLRDLSPEELRMRAFGEKLNKALKNTKEADKRKKEKSVTTSNLSSYEVPSRSLKTISAILKKYE